MRCHISDITSSLVLLKILTLDDDRSICVETIIIKLIISLHVEELDFLVRLSFVLCVK